MEHITHDEHMAGLERHMDNLASDYASGDVKVRMPAHAALKKLESMGRKARDILTKAYRVDSSSSDPAEAKDVEAAKAKVKADRQDKGRVA